MDLVFKRKTLYKNGGASYKLESAFDDRRSGTLYCSPSTFSGAAPETFTLAGADAQGFALAPAPKEAKTAEAKAGREAERTAKKAEREVERTAKRAAREKERTERAAAREAEREARKAAKTAASAPPISSGEPPVKTEVELPASV